MLPLTEKEKSQQKSIGLMAVLWIYAAVLKAESSPVGVEVSRYLSPENRRSSDMATSENTFGSEGLHLLQMFGFSSLILLKS
ncbi:hypothetical protein Q9966_011824 [Columba livia]|nr:hypothetical protein Q9966_011824 [Columba livia]